MSDTSMSLKRVLSVEDDPMTAKDIFRALTETSDPAFSVTSIANGADGLTQALKETYDVIMLDRMLPGLDGLTLLKTLRTVGNQTPVLMLSALGDVDERVRGLRAGGDDYLTKPFDPDELVARLEVLVRRHNTKVQMPETLLIVGNVELDLIARSAKRDGVAVELLPTEYKLLEFMMRNAGHAVTRTMLFEAVWHYHYNPGTKVIDVHMGRLRKKLDPLGNRPMITTVRGSGYRLHA